MKDVTASCVLPIAILACSLFACNPLQKDHSLEKLETSINGIIANIEGDFGVAFKNLKDMESGGVAIADISKTVYDFVSETAE